MAKVWNQDWKDWLAKGQMGLPTLSPAEAEWLAEKALTDHIANEVMLEAGYVGSASGEKILKFDGKPVAYVNMYLTPKKGKHNHPYKPPTSGWAVAKDCCEQCHLPASSALHMQPLKNHPFVVPALGYVGCEKCGQVNSSPIHMPHSLEPTMHTYQSDGVTSGCVVCALPSYAGVHHGNDTHPYLNVGNGNCGVCGATKLSTVHTGHFDIPMMPSETFAQIMETTMTKYESAGPKFYKGTHDMHLMDPVGMVDTNCPDCQALWDSRVKKLAVAFMVQLAKDCPELGAGMTDKILAAWHKAAAQE